MRRRATLFDSKVAEVRATQRMFRVILLLLLLMTCLFFRPITGGCYNQSDYNNCVTCYETLVNALINTDDNKYNLYDGFFPPDATPPVLVEVTYRFEGCSNCSQPWYWTEGTFYIYQPLKIFVFRSLFFAPTTLRQGSVELNLPSECRNSSDRFLKMLTQKLKAYAMSLTATPRIDNNYVAKAVSGKQIDIKKDNVYGDLHNVMIYQLLQSYLTIPFFIMLILLTTVLVFLLLLCYFEGPREPLLIRFYNILKNTKHQASIAAIVATCFCFTTYSFALDMVTWRVEKKTTLPSYYDNSLGIHQFNRVFAFVSFIFLIGGMVVGFLSLCSMCLAENESDLESSQRLLAFLISVFLVAASTAMSLSFHLPNVLIAWTTDPVYASKITVYYGIILFVYYHTFKNTYFLSHILKYYVCIKKTKKGYVRIVDEESDSHKISKNCAVFLGIFFVMIAVFPLVGFHVMSVFFFYYIPINHSIEESVNGIRVIYDDAVLLIGALIAYNFVWFYFSVKKFSIENALKRVLREMKDNPFKSHVAQKDEQETSSNSHAEVTAEQPRVQEHQWETSSDSHAEVTAEQPRVQEHERETSFNSHAEVTAEPPRVQKQEQGSPVKSNSNERKWKDLSEEDRMVQLIEGLLEREAKKQ